MGEAIPLSRFLIVHPGINAAAINGAIAQGQHVLFTPGVHRFAEPLRVDRPGAIILGWALQCWWRRGTWR